jgi:2-oxoglutarate ferredoxin oxidoreductase subunit gamma
VARIEIRITGFGGQGVILLGYIIGRACAINANFHATMTQSFGPEARGSACSSTLVISDKEVLYPYVTRTDILVALSSDGYEKYFRELKHEGVLIYDLDLVDPQKNSGHQCYGIPATRIAEKLGRKIVQNAVVCGFVGAVTEIVPKEALREALKSSVPAGTEEINLQAFDAGWAYFEENYAGSRSAFEKERQKSSTAD